MRVDTGKLAELVKLNQTLELNTEQEIDRNISATKKADQTTLLSLKGGSQLNIDKSFLSDLGSLKDIQRMAENQDLKTVKDQMALLSNTMSLGDYQKFMEEGYRFHDTEITTIVTVVDKIQISLAANCEDYNGAIDDVNMEQIEAAVKYPGQVYKIAKKLKEQDLPITEENIEDSLDALDTARNLVPLTNGTIQYLMTNELTPTIENIYKAEYSGSMDRRNSYDLKSLEEQINRIVKEAGMSVTKDTTADAKWLVVNQVPLTKESLEYLNDLKNLTLPLNEEQVIDYSVKAIKEGKRPIQANLLNTDDIFMKASNTLEVISNTSDEDLKSIIDLDKEVTVENLRKIQKGEYFLIDELSLEVSDSEALEKKELAFITAKRQLEEVRLRMTVEVNVKLLKQGIHIETESLENVIKELKQVEQNYYQTLLENGNVPATDENIALYQETTKQVEAIKSVPNFVLGSAAVSKSVVTIDFLYHEGTTLKSTLEKANQTYDALMTKPRADMGDSIKKAFQNVDAILQDLGLDTTQMNERAVRILSYNQMEITQDSIFQIKQADAVVNSLMKNLTPAATLELIRQNINPLNMEVGELNSKIQEIKNDVPLQKEEKYSEFLWKLEKNNQISSEEKQAYIGIYRLLSQVEKTDGSVIGALVNQDAKLTLKNLLTGVRSNKSKGMDISIDDEFGGLEELISKGPTISEQIEMGFKNNSQGESNTESGRQQLGYYEMAVNQVLDEVTPSKLKGLEQKVNIYHLPIDEMAYELNQMSSSISAEDMAYERNQLDDLAKLKHIENDVIQMLTDISQPVTIQNLLSANTMLTERGSLYRKLLKEVNQISEDSDSENKELLTSLMDVVEGAGGSFEDKDSMESVYGKLENISKETLTMTMSNSKFTSIDLKEIQTLHKEIKLYREFGRKERYEIPMVIGDEVTSIRLTFVKDIHEKGKVRATLESGTLGKVAAEFSLTDGKISGYIISDTDNAREILKENHEYLVSELQSRDNSVEKIEYIKSKGMNLNQFDLLKEKEEIGTSVSTKELYQIAKAFIVTMNHISREE